MTLTPSEVAKLQKHNADLVKENATLTRDNAELRRQIEAIKLAISKNNVDDHVYICNLCKHDTAFNDLCIKCHAIRRENFELIEPPDA